MLAFALAAVATSVLADRPVYRALDANGGVTYTDRPTAAGDPVRLRPPAGPSGLQSDAAVARSESDRLYYERLRLESLQPRPVLLFQPRAEPTVRSEPQSLPHWRLRSRYDPKLPDSQPASSLERRYHYDGR